MSVDSEIFDQLKVRTPLDDLPPLKSSLTPEQLERYRDDCGQLTTPGAFSESYRLASEAERSAGRLMGHSHRALRLLCESQKSLIAELRNRVN